MSVDDPVVIDNKAYMAYIALTALCSESRYAPTYLRRWGDGVNGGRFKAYKLGILLKKCDPVLYEEVSRIFSSHEPHILGKKLFLYLSSRLKSKIKHINTLGDLCNVIHEEGGKLYALE